MIAILSVFGVLSFILLEGIIFLLLHQPRWRVFLLLVLFLGGSLCSYGAYHRRSKIKRALSYVYHSSRAEWSSMHNNSIEGPSIQGEQSEKKSTRKNSLRLNFSGSGLNKDRYSLHRRKAKKISDGAYIQNIDSLKVFQKRGELVKIEVNDAYEVKRLNHSHAVLHTKANARLKELSRRFKAKTKGTSEEDAYFVISSGSRTHAQQKSLRKINSNATRGKSAHSYGAAIDIARIRTNGSAKKAKKALLEVISDMQKEKKLLICPESTCIHLTFM